MLLGYNVEFNHYTCTYFAYSLTFHNVFVVVSWLPTLALENWEIVMINSAGFYFMFIGFGGTFIES